MAKLKFLRNEAYNGVSYEVCQNYRWNNHWQLKHQVPDVTKLPKGSTHISYLRFPSKYTYLPDDSGDRYNYVYLKPLNIGDTYRYFGDYVGVVSDVRIEGDKDYGFYITIECDKTFETINKERILLDKTSSYKITLNNFLCFFDNVEIVDLNKINHKTTLEIMPYFQGIIKQQQEEINLLKRKNNEYEKILGNIDNRIKEVTYSTISKNTKQLSKEDEAFESWKGKTQRKDFEQYQRDMKEANKRDKKWREEMDEKDFNDRMNKIGSDGRTQWDFLYGTDKFGRKI